MGTYMNEVLTWFEASVTVGIGKTEITLWVDGESETLRRTTGNEEFLEMLQFLDRPGNTTRGVGDIP